MNIISAVYEFVLVNKKELVDMVAYLVLAASIFIKLIPTLDKNNRFLPFVKWIGKYIALDKYGPSREE
jgi:hypothetical protein